MTEDPPFQYPIPTYMGEISFPSGQGEHMQQLAMICLESLLKLTSDETDSYCVAGPYYLVSTTGYKASADPTICNLSSKMMTEAADGSSQPLTSPQEELSSGSMHAFPARTHTDGGAVRSDQVACVPEHVPMTVPDSKISVVDPAQLDEQTLRMLFDRNDPFLDGRRTRCTGCRFNLWEPRGACEHAVHIRYNKVVSEGMTAVLASTPGWPAGSVYEPYQFWLYKKKRKISYDRRYLDRADHRERLRQRKKIANNPPANHSFSMYSCDMFRSLSKD